MPPAPAGSATARFSSARSTRRCASALGKRAATLSEQVTDNKEGRRYELDIGGRIAHAEYERRDRTIVFTHTRVPSELEGQGVGSRLVASALADVRARGLKVLPLCQFVSAYIDRHPEFQDLLAD